MVKINKLLKPVKEQRIEDIYDSRIFTNEQKIKLAEKEIILKDIISGNRSQQELLDQISSLEQSNIQRANADKNTIDSLNAKLKEVNDIVRNTISEDRKLSIYNTDDDKTKSVKTAYNDLDANFRRSYYEFINSDEKTDLQLLPPKLAQEFVNLGLFINDGNDARNWLITDKGLRLFNLISRQIRK